MRQPSRTVSASAGSEPAGAALESSRQAAQTFDLPDSPFVYRASGLLLAGARAQFVALDDPVSREDGVRLMAKDPLGRVAVYTGPDEVPRGRPAQIMEKPPREPCRVTGGVPCPSQLTG